MKNTELNIINLGKDIPVSIEGKFQNGLRVGVILIIRVDITDLIYYNLTMTSKYILWANGKGLSIRGNWIIGLLQKADKLNLEAYVEKHEAGRIIKIYKKVDNRVRCIND